MSRPLSPRDGPFGHDPGPRPILMVALLVLGALAAGYFALGMPGMDHGGETVSMPQMQHDPSALGWTRQSVDEFAATVAGDVFLVVNVHVPDDGTIAGTDLTIPYTSIVGDARLPTDLATPLALYCRSGNMSTIAARALLDAGYRDIVELDGGMDAWQRDSRSLQA